MGEWNLPRTFILALAMAVLGLLAGLSAHADPDPPLADGGNVTFDGNWSVDPGDHLVYVNQTIVLNGDLEVSPDGTLDLVNSTIMFNGTYAGEFGLIVQVQGGLNLTGGSGLRRTPAGSPFWAVVSVGAHLLVEDSSVAAVGYDSPDPHMTGLYSYANDTVVRRGTFSGCYRGLILDGVNGSVVEDTVFEGGGLVGLTIRGGATNVTTENLTFLTQDTSVLLEDVTGARFWNISVGGGTYGIQLNGSSIVLFGGSFLDVEGGVVRYLSGGSADWVVDGAADLVNSTMTLNGSLEVRYGGELSVRNSTLALMNVAANGTNGIEVLSGGGMRVTEGSNVTAAGGSNRYDWYVRTGGHLTLRDSQVSMAGWDPSWPGLVLESSDNEVADTVFHDCYHGLTVTGDGTDVSSSTFDACVKGASWMGGNSSISDCRFVGCSLSGLDLDACYNVSVVNCSFDMRTGVRAIRALECQGLAFHSVSVAGPSDHGIIVLSCTDVLIDGATLDSRRDTLYASGVGRTNLTLDMVDVSGALWLDGIVDARLGNVSVQGSSTLQGVLGCDMTDCSLSALSSTGSRSVRVLRCMFGGPVSLQDVHLWTVDTCVVTTAGDGVRLQDCTNTSLRDVTVVDATTAFAFLSTAHVEAYGCHAINASTRGFELQGTSHSLLVNASVNTAPSAVEVAYGSNNTIRGLLVTSCPVALDARGTAEATVVEGTDFSNLALAVRASDGANLTIRDCNFLDCSIGIEGDTLSMVLVETVSISSIEGSSVTMRGRFSVGQGGVLNISASRITFIGQNVSGMGMATNLTSTLRLLDGTVVDGVNVSYSIRCEGKVLAVDATLVGGGDIAGMAALVSTGVAAVVTNVTFRDCQLALLLAGTDPTVRDCTFSGNRESIRLAGALRPRIIDCRFGQSNTSYDLEGDFEGSLQIIGCTFEGGNQADMAIKLGSPSTENSPLVLINVTISNYTVWGLEDNHYGTLSMTGCRLDSASMTVGPVSNHAVLLTDLHVLHGLVVVGPGGFSVTDCVFVNASFRVHDNSRGSLMSDCSFTGSLGPGHATLEVDGSLLLTFRDLAMRDVEVSLTVRGGSEVTVSNLRVIGASGNCLEVNGSIVRLEGCRLWGLSGTGLRVSNAGSRVEFRNGSIQAVPGRTGYEVDASNGGDAWFLNTSLNSSSVLSTRGGRVEVLWFVTVEPSLPWGGTLSDPDRLVVLDVTGVEVVNTTRADLEMRLREFIDEDGERTWRTPHTFIVRDAGLGVACQEGHTIGSTCHVVLDLLDVASPVARAGPDQVEDEDLVITLDGSMTSDNDPTFHQSGSFRWTFDEHGTVITLTGEVVQFVFSVPGKYWINLTVTDAAGNVGTDMVIVQVRDRTPPTVRFTGNVTVEEDEASILDASATTDNDPTFDASIGTFLWEIDVEGLVLSWGTASFTHTFSEPGVYLGSLSVSDRAGNMAREEFWVLVQDVTPPVIEGVSSAVFFEPSDGLLDASSCSDNVGITKYLWRITFLDGSSTVLDLEGVTPMYRFDGLGSYRVSLTLNDLAGNVNSTEITLVYDDVPTISVQDWGVAMAGEVFSTQVVVLTEYSLDMSVSITNGPPGARIEGPLGETRLVWTPGAEHAGTDVVIEVGVHDGFVSSQDSIVIHVNPARGENNQPPVILSEPPRSARLSTPYIYPVDAQDPDGDVLGFILVSGPEGMSISQVGTIAWDPPFTQGTVLVDVHLLVTDGRDIAEQAWTIRWKEPPNRSPSVPFTIDPVETRTMEEFWVDLAVFITDPTAYTLDEDDPNHDISWSAVTDAGMVELLYQEGLLFRFRALDDEGETTVTFVAKDPWGAWGSTEMPVNVKGPGPGPEEGMWGPLPLVVLAVVIALVVAGGAIVIRRRGVADGMTGPGEGMGGGFEPPGDETPEGDEAIAAGLSAEGTTRSGTFVEIEAGPLSMDEPRAPAPVVPAPGGTRVIDRGAGGPRRAFSVEGVAVLGPRGVVTTSTGQVDEVVGPHQDAIKDIRAALGGDGLAVLELEGHRVVVGFRSGTGLLCVLRGREDDAFRDTIYRRLDDLTADGSQEVALGAIEDVLAAGSSGKAQVVKDAWTARVDAAIDFRGSVLVLDIIVHNATDHILNNVRLRVEHDRDALTLHTVSPKLLMAHGRMALGNVPPMKEREVEVSFIPELCLSSNLRVMVTYIDVEGRTVYVPSRPIPVTVECPYIEAGTDVDEERLVSMSEDGLGFTGRRVYNYGLDVDYKDLFRIATRLVVERGPMKVIELDDDSLMRSEAWFLGSGRGGAPRVLIRVSSHGADHMLELFVTSDDAATATGLLAFLAGEILDSAASEMPGKRVERVRDASTLEEMAVWPSLLDYKVMGE